MVAIINIATDLATNAPMRVSTDIAGENVPPISELYRQCGFAERSGPKRSVAACLGGQSTDRAHNDEPYSVPAAR